MGDPLWLSHNTVSTREDSDLIQLSDHCHLRWSFWVEMTVACPRGVSFPDKTGICLSCPTHLSQNRHWAHMAFFYHRYRSQLSHTQLLLGETSGKPPTVLTTFSEASVILNHFQGTVLDLLSTILWGQGLLFLTLAYPKVKIPTAQNTQRLPRQVPRMQVLMQTWVDTDCS